jgi:hypothetical protein
VQALLKTVPFETPPTYLRVRIYRYSFTDRSEKRATGRWWRRSLIGDYPPVRLLPGEGRTTERLQFLEH